MANYQLTVEARSETGKSYARKLRVEGKIPAVIYGSGKESTSIEVGIRDVEKAMSAHGSLIDLDLGGASKTVLVKDIHRDPVRGTLLHLDFHEIDLSKKLEIIVPVRIIGEDDRANDGGVVQVLLWELEVLCLPMDIPEAISVDVTKMGLDEAVTVADLDLPAGVEVLVDADEAVLKIAIPAAVDLGEESDELDEGDAPEAEGEAAESEE